MKILLMTANEIELIWAKLQPQQRFDAGLSVPHGWLPMRSTLILAKKNTEILDHKIKNFEEFSLKEFYKFLEGE